MSGKKAEGFFILFLAFLFFPGVLPAQVMVSPTGKPSSLIICSDPGTFSLQIANTTGGIMTGAELTVDLPTGAYYVPGSVTAATESDITNPEHPVFSLPPINNNTAHTVTFLVRIVCGYNNTSNFDYLVSYNNVNYTGFDTPLQNYYYPEPVITQITNSTAIIPVGQTVTRNITIEQQGINSSLDTLILLDEHTSDIQIVSVTTGTLHPYIGPGPLIVDTIIITGSDLPGGNGKFDAGESIVIGETVKLVGCTNGESTLKAGWGCFGTICDYYSAFPSVSPASGTPSIAIAFTSNKKSWGFTDNSGYVEFTMTNNGTGAGTAFDVIPMAGFSSGGSIYYPNSDWLNEIDSFSVAGNYLSASFNYSAGAPNGQYAHFTTLTYNFDPDGTGTGLDDADGDGFFDDLPPGKTVIIRAHTYYDWTEAVSRIPTGKNCGSGWTNSAYQAFRYGYTMKNQCGISSGVIWLPNTNLIQFQTYNTNNVLTETPSDLYDNSPVWYEQTVVTTTAVNNEGCSSDSVIYKVTLPPGVIIATGYNATFKGVGMGLPLITGDTAIYFLDKTKILSGGIFRVPVVLKCNLPHSTTGLIHSELRFWCDKTNYKNRYFTYWCADSPLFGLQCPVTNCPDPSASLFIAERQTLGWTNERCTTKIVKTTPGVRLDHAFSRDTVRFILCGKINGNIDSLFFQLKHNAIGGSWGNQMFIDFLSDTLRFYDIETASWYNCPGILPQITNGATSYLKAYFGDLTKPGNCLQGLSFTAGDSVVFTLYGTVKNIAQTEWRTVGGLRAELSWQEHGIFSKCNDLGYTFLVCGSNYPLLAGTNYQQIVLNGCSTFVYEGMIYRSLDICGGEIGFPNEFRPFCVLDTMNFTLPEGFMYQAGSSIHSYYMHDGSYRTESIADPVVTSSPAGTILSFYRTGTWGYAAYYDCGNDHERIRFNATPSCKVQGNYNYSMDARGRYQFYADGTGIYKASASSVSITYTPPLMSLTPLIVTAEGREDTVTWKVRICNSRSFGASNSWMAFENASENINITEIRDITVPASPVSIMFSGYGPGKYWFQSGNFNGNECRIYEIKAVYNSCEFDSILIRHGYNCAGYPLNPGIGYNPGGYSCTENNAWIFLDPKDVSLNVAITAPVNPVYLCDTLQYMAEVTNSQLSYAYDLSFTVTVPPGVSINPGSSVFCYPYNSSVWRNISDPVNNPPGSNKWVYSLSEDNMAVQFLEGVDSLPLNGYRIKFSILTDCSFTSGTTMKFSASASNACGDEKSRSSYTPPIHISGLPTNVNLYVINTQVPGQLTACSDPSVIKIKVINLGPSSVSQIEKLGFNIDDAFDYEINSLVNIHNGPTGIASNLVVGGIRYINFAIQPNLQVNDSIVFTFNITDVDPASLVCDSISMETTTLLVAAVDCETAPGGSCLIQSITSSVLTYKPVVKDILSLGSFTGSSIPSGITGEIVSFSYYIRNTGTDTLHLSSVNMFFFNDGNGNDIPDDPISDSLYSQEIPVPLLLPGDSIYATATFFVPAEKTCRIYGAVRLPFNGCICNDVIRRFDKIHFYNAGDDKEFCVESPGIIGFPALPGYSYIWLPPEKLNLNTVSDPEFYHPGPLTQQDTSVYILFTTRSGNCNTQDTVRVITVPRPVILNIDLNDSLCSFQSTNIQPSTFYIPTSYSWNASGSSANVTGQGPGSGIIISQVLSNSGDTNEYVNYFVVPVYKGCAGDTTIFTETVHPVPGVSFSPLNDTICGSTACYIQISSNTPGSTFSWITSGSSFLNGFSPGSGNQISQIINNTSFLTGQVDYFVQPQSQGCYGISSGAHVIVRPLPPTDFGICTDNITTNTAKPFKLLGSTPYGGVYTGNGVDSVSGIFNPSAAGTGVHQIYYRYINVYSCILRDTFNINVVPDPFSVCGSLLSDVRNGITYKTILLGGHCWMAEDLRYGNRISLTTHQRDNCIPEKYCSQWNCAPGTAILYQWDELMRYEETENSQGLCPPGWHVPAVSEWNQLFAAYYDNGFAGSPLKYTGFSGFDALLPGAGFSNQLIEHPGFAGFYWTSTSHGDDKAWSEAMNMTDPSVALYPSRRLNAFSVRCVKD